MWCCVDPSGVVLKCFASDWSAAVRWAVREGGDLEILWSLSAVEGEVLH